MRYGVATVDVTLTAEVKASKAYKLWSTMIDRCYSPFHLKRHPHYAECSVCPEWLSFSSFRDWLGDRDTEGLQLDKDLKIPGNKVYSPEACVFIPAQINSLFHAPNAKNNGLPQGVKINPKTKKFQASVSYKGKDKHLGYFHELEDAVKAYKTAKLGIIQEFKEIYSCPDVQHILALHEKNFM